MATTPRVSERSDLREVLRRRFGFEDFRPGQEEVVLRVLAGENVLAVMPTGGGKSLCYQLPAVMLPGATVVVSPLIALMQDQAAGMIAGGIARDAVAVINSTIRLTEQAQRLGQVAAGKAKIVLVAPERFRNQRFMEALERARLSLLAIDEAHCISEWGPDFRPDYLFLRDVIQALGRPRVLALTATATPEVQRDIVARLGLEQAATVVAGFDRPSLHLEVIPCADEAAKLHQVHLLARRGPGIVYCGTRRDCEQVALFLQRAGLRADYYHGRLDSQERVRVHSAFSAGELDAIAATTAFGMGIDKADIRYVAHYDVPASLEEYYQQAGRAGRDGEPARCVLLYDPDDFGLQRFLIDGSWPSGEDLHRTFAALVAAAREGQALIAPRDLESAAALDDTRMRVAIRELERAGAVRRVLDTPRGEMVVNLLTETLTERTVVEREAEMASVKQGRYQKMEQMRAYAEATGCRMAIIRRYFGEADVPEACGHCDHCLTQHARAGAGKTGDSDQTEPAAAVILRAASDLNRRVGRTLLAQILCASTAQDAQPHRRRSCWGRLADYSQRQVVETIDGLIKQGHLATLELGDRERPRPVLTITERGREAIERGDWPPVGPATPATDEREVTVTLARLRQERRRLAAQAGLPPYTICGDETLATIARLRPATVSELAAVKNMGARRAERWGESLLAALDARSSDSVPSDQATRAEHREADRAVRAFLARPPAKELRGPWAVGRALDFHSRRVKGEWRRTRAGRMAYEFKYAGRSELADRLAEMLADLVSSDERYQGIEVIAHVPSTAPDRTYDPVALLAERLAARLKIGMTRAVAKVRATAPQKEMTRQAQKAANVAGAFAVRPAEAVRGRRVLLLDDLFDTGQTMAEVWRVLTAAGAQEVVVLTITKTVHDVTRG
jgi:ATP-dependent DNA helicase RecQ